jgi:DNA ligase-1
MGSDEVFLALSQLAEEPSKNSKIEYLKELMKDEFFLDVIRKAYDPFITFGVKNIELTFERGEGQFNFGTNSLLRALQKRELTGNAARDAVSKELERLSYMSRLLLLNILNKDLRAGFDVKSINKARKGTIPEFPYMRCSLPSEVNLERWDWKGGIIVQEKADGLFCNMMKFTATTVMQTRNGQQFPDKPFKTIQDEYFKEFPNNTVSMGEVLVMRDGVVLSRKEGNGVINHVMKGGEFDNNEKPILKLWDIVDTTEYIAKQSVTPYYSRLARLRDPVSYCKDISLIETRLVTSYREAIEFYKEARKLGKEGAVAKTLEGIWKSHTSKDQVKLKNESVCELRVLDFLPGTGKNYDTFGSLLCVSECGELSAAVSGFTDAKRLEIHLNREKWRDSIISVKFNEVINDRKLGWSLFSPRFEEERFDKNTADTLERIQQIVKEI